MQEAECGEVHATVTVEVVSQMLRKQVSLLFTVGPAGAGAHDGWGRKPTPQWRHLPRKRRGVNSTYAQKVSLNSV